MTNEELIQLIDDLRELPKENEWVEFKAGNAVSNEKIGQYISAISNAACIHNQSFGYLVFGLKNENHKVQGTSFRFKNRKEGNEELELWIRRLLHPSVKFQHYPCTYEGHQMEIIRIPAAVSEPTHFKKIPYTRFDSSLTDLRNFPDYIRAIYNSQQDWSAQIVQHATIEDLDPQAVNLARKKFKEKLLGKPFYEEIDQWPDSLFLDKAKITIDGQITNAAIVLLGKPESTHFISPCVVQITWKLDTEEKAYEHFEPPLLLAVNDVLNRVRNVKYKFFPSNQLIATEVLKYDPEVILEALNNCIAHQNYQMHSRIILTEQVGKLMFANAGEFFEGKADDYTSGERTPKKYRNRFLADAMVTLNMIDSMGYGIHKMYKSQKQRFFPLPDYTKSSRDEVVVEIYGHTIDEKYAKLLIECKENLDLTDTVLLDKVQKGQPITPAAANKLKKKGFIEGRRPNYYISVHIASITGEKAQYTRNKGLDKEVFKSFVIKHIENHGYATRDEIDTLLLDKLPDYLDDKQRKKKIENLLQEMKKETITNIGSNKASKWVKSG